MAGEDDLARARHAIGTIESSNNYGITGPATGNDVPLGRYQVMRSNLPGWSQEALGRQVSPQEYLSNPGLQDQVFNHHFGKYMDKYGPEGASRAWFGGEGSVYNNGGSKDILGTSVNGYGSKFSSLFNGGAGADGSQVAQGDGGPPGSPADAGFGHMSDDDLKAIAAQPDTDSSDLSHMSDDELKAIAGGGDQSDGYSLGGLAKNAATDAGDIWSGIKATGSRALSDAGSVLQGNFAPAAGDVLGIMKSLNPFLATAKGIQQGAPMVQSAINDPAQAAKNAADYAYQKPVSTAMNAAAVALPGAGGATRAALAAPGKVAGPIVRGGTELLSGVASEAQKLASKAGELGGAEGAAFRGQMANPDAAAMQDTVQRAKQGARAERNADYQAGMGDVAANSPDPIATNPHVNVTQAAQAARADAYDGTFLKHEDVPGVMDRVDRAIAEHAADASQTGNAVSMDALKQRLRSIMMSTAEGTPERRAASSVHNALRDEIATAAPGYGDVMNQYGGASRDIGNAISSLGAGERASRFSTAGKLMSALRPDSSVARGARAQSLADMARQQPTLPYQIAGATMNPPLPRGIVGRMGALHNAAAVGGAAALVPALIKALPMLLAASPRAVGEARYAIGAAKRGARSAGVTQKNIGNLVDALRLISTKQNKDQ